MSSNFRDVIAQDTPLRNDSDTATPGFGQPISQSEIDELLYSEEWSAEERIARLRDMRAQLAELEGPDFGDDDPLALIQQIDAAVASLRDLGGEGMDATSVDHDPSAHRETLSPDSDELAEIEEEDEESVAELDEPIDETEWVDGDGFEPEKGVR